MARIIEEPSRTLQEYILQPRLVPDIRVSDVDLSTPLYRNGIRLNVPILSAAMQSVTGPRMAVAMAGLGGSGVIYCSQPVEDEAKMIEIVKARVHDDETMKEPSQNDAEYGIVPRALLDRNRRYVVGAAINTHDYEKRVPALVRAGADYLVTDTSQAISEYVKRTLKFVKKEFPTMPVIGGNIVTSEGFEFLIENDADAVKVGMGSGSICITQEQLRLGLGQASTIIDVADIRDRYYRETGCYIPLCSDGGVMTSGDIAVALALGADYVMTGGYIAGTDESNGPEDVMKDENGNVVSDKDGNPIKAKLYWGEGSHRAREWRKERYDQASFEEGFEKTVPYVGCLRNRMLPALTKIQDSIRKAGSRNISDFHENAVLRILSPLSIELSRQTKPSVS